MTEPIQGGHRNGWNRGLSRPSERSGQESSAPLLAGPSALLAQSAPGAAVPPTFEVATIKPTAPSDKGSGVWSPPGIGRFWAQSVSLQFLIQMAFGVEANDVASKPAWLDSDYFDVMAKPEDGILLSRAELRPRLQNLLRTRFQLATHCETRMESGYALVVVAKRRPKLQPTKGDRPPGFLKYVGPGRLEGINWTMDYLATMLEKWAGRPVANKTGGHRQLRREARIRARH